MEINRNTLFSVAKAIAFPIPTAVEAIYDAVTDKPAAPPPPPPPPPDLPGATATPADAHAKASALWNKGNEGKDIVTRPALAALEQKAANWEKAGKDKNDPAMLKQAAEFRSQAEAMRKELDGADMEAVKQLAGNRKLEKEALKALSPEDLVKYQKLEKTLENDPQGHLALQLLLIDGKLKNDPKTQNKDGKGLLDALGQMSEAKLATPLKNADLIGQACREMANPASIKQKGLNTCSAAAVQIMVATERPAEYVRILTGLAGEEGKPLALTGGGKTVERNGGTEYDDQSGRTDTSRLWQAAFMTMGAKAIDANATYDNATDTITWGNGSTSTDGIVGAGAALMAHSATGGDWYYADQGVAMDKTMDSVINDLKAKPAVHAKLELGSDYDASGNPGKTQTVTLEKFTPAKTDANGKVLKPATYTVKDDATGKVQQLTGQELGARLQGVPSKGFDREKQTDFMMKQILDDTGKGEHPVVMLRWGEFQGATPKAGGAKGDAFNHFVTVTKADDKNVTFLNSHGKEETMPLAEFKNKLANVTSHGKAVAP